MIVKDTAMAEDRVARRNRSSLRGLWLLAALAAVAALLILAALLKSSAATQRARLEIEQAPPATGEKSSTVSRRGTTAGPLSLG
ncbi:MAG: hypothetical protein EON85_09920 [Brevundimonas sp.]|nr:MAG: hypothetical protein EON85_09920 [Brevundimonas sp.]